VADNPHKAARDYAQRQAMERLEGDPDLVGWHPKRVDGSDADTPGEIEAFRQWQTACDRLNRKPDGMVGRRRAADLIRARRGVTNYGIWSPK
jgi:hypothetical protein